MTTEYRDGTVAELQKGDGFSFGTAIRLDETQNGRFPAWRYLGEDQYQHVEGRGQTYDRLKADEGPNAIRIWPAYFKDKQPAVEFDLEALRAKVEKLRDAATARNRTAYQGEDYDEARVAFAVSQSLDEVLDLLPPQPQPTLEDDWTRNEEGRSNSSPVFKELCKVVEELIMGDVHMLVQIKAERTAGLIMAQLAHKYGLRPAPKEDEKS